MSNLTFQHNVQQHLNCSSLEMAKMGRLSYKQYELITILSESLKHELALFLLVYRFYSPWSQHFRHKRSNFEPVFVGLPFLTPLTQKTSHISGPKSDKRFKAKCSRKIGTQLRKGFWDSVKRRMWMVFYLNDFYNWNTKAKVKLKVGWDNPFGSTLL